jgi:hypothetical protein
VGEFWVSLQFQAALAANNWKHNILFVFGFPKVSFMSFITPYARRDLKLNTKEGRLKLMKLTYLPDLIVNRSLNQVSLVTSGEFHGRKESRA